MAKRYYFGKPYEPTKEHNILAWVVVARYLEVYGPSTIDDLADALVEHPRPGGPRGFIRYCIRDENQWLREVNDDEQF